MKRSATKFAAAILLVLCLVSICQACPNCKSAVANEGDSMAIGFAWSIGLMMLAPAIIVVAWVVAIRKIFRSETCRSAKATMVGQRTPSLDHRSPNLSSNHP